MKKTIFHLTFLAALVVCVSVIIFSQRACIAEYQQQIQMLDTQIAKTKRATLWSTKATVTAYTARKRECDSDPKITASNLPVKEGTIAVSRDLFWAGWTFGRKVYIEGHGVFEIRDVMNKRHTKAVDIFRWSLREAKKYKPTVKLVALLAL